MEINVQSHLDHCSSMMQNCLINLGLHGFILPNKIKLDSIKINISDNNLKGIAGHIFLSHLIVCISPYSWKCILSHVIAMGISVTVCIIEEITQFCLDLREKKWSDSSARFERLRKIYL